ncbi:MAG: hypothetical protein AAB776_00155 [Patescibacteria group bacterium]
MKKVILALGLLLAVGGGCVSLGKLGGDKVVEGDWSLAFDLPSGWFMTAPYQSPNTEAVVPTQSVEKLDNEIYLQTTDKAILTGGVGAEASVPADSYVTLEGNSQIRVSRLDPRRVVPSEAEDMGNGFSKVKLCDDGGECEIYGHHNYDYYLETEDAIYKFIVYGQDINQIEDIIKSAEVVTATDESAE